MLVIVIAVLVAVEILVLLIGTAIPNSRLTAQVKLEEEMKINVGPVQFSHIRESSSFSLFLVQGEGINQAIYIISCDNKKADVWISILFVYKGLLQLAAIFMAFTTRKVKIKALNDTKETGLMIYLNSIILTVLLVIAFALDGNRDVFIGIYGIAIFLAATLFLAVVFIPRVSQYYTIHVDVFYYYSEEG